MASQNLLANHDSPETITVKFEHCSAIQICINPWRRSDVFIVNFEHISHLVLVFLLLTLNM